MTAAARLAARPRARGAVSQVWCLAVGRGASDYVALELSGKGAMRERSPDCK